MAQELILPEYGRNIQNMVEIALKIEDRAERNRCARSIINCMGNLFPYLRDNEEFQHKLWDHLALMANFNLDIDYPFEVASNIAIHPKPERIQVPHMKIKEMHYGRFIEGFIKRVADDEEIATKKDLILIIANYMKRCYSTYNQEVQNDSIIFNDLYEMSGGKIDVRDSGMRLQEVHHRKALSRTQNNSKQNQKR